MAPLYLPQVWGSVSAAAFVDPQQVWGDIMFDERHQDKNGPVWGRGERRRAAPSIFRGKRFAGEPRSDAADLGSSSEDTGSGVSADERPSERPGVRGLQRLFQRPRHEGVQEQDKRWGTRMSEGGLRILPLHCPLGSRTRATRQGMGCGQNAQEMSGRSSSSLPRCRDDQRRHQRRDRGDQPLNVPEGAEKSSVRWVAEPFQYQQGGRVARQWRWRRLRRDARFPQGWRELDGDHDTAMESQDRDGSDPGLYPVEPAGQGGGGGAPSRVTSPWVQH